MKATANDYSSGTVLKPGGFNWTQDGTYTGSDRIEVAPFSLGNFQLPLSDIFRILNNGVANATEDYPLGNVPWPTSATALPQFTHFPFSLAQLCGGDISSFYGVGAETGAIYNNPNSHPGLDIFAPVGSNIYSIAGSGIVTSIGVGKIAGNLNRSGAR